MTDRRIREAGELEAVAFDGAGLVPVVAQDGGAGRVLMVAWANREALEKTLETGQLHFWSRSRGELWRKGKTSGNVLRLRALHLDCDGDTVLALVDPTGPACHTGEESCFGEGSGPLVHALWRVILDRDLERPEGSYTVRLLEDENLRFKKLGEETAELVTALARGRRDEVGKEAADLLYHLLVALRGGGVELSDVLGVLEARRP